MYGKECIRSFLAKKRLLGILLLFVVHCPVVGQMAAVKGKLRDTAGHKNLSFAVIAVLEDDSTLLRFTRSAKDGSFALRDLPAGHYLLWITHPSLSDYSAPVELIAGSVKDLGVVIPLPRADTLAAVVVTPKDPTMRLKGDTLEYTTAGLKLKVNATVENLLQRLPGIQVDQDGSITVNGQKVERLLVDGEDIFSSDPKIVTRNFNADLISKLQVLDKKSDRAAFTGVDDGHTTKTLNLVLKEDRKKGYFGKVEAGGGTDGYYNNNALLGSFKGKRQFAALGILANNGTTGFSGSGGGGNDIVGLSLNGDLDDFFSASAGVGIPQAIGVGMHYSNKWNNDEEYVSGNYSFGNTLTYPISSVINQQILPDTIYVQKQYSQSINNKNLHLFSGIYDVNLDTLSTVHLSLNVNSSFGNNQFVYKASTYLNDTLVNTSDRLIYSNFLSQELSGNIFWRKKFHKEGRLLAITEGLRSTNNGTTGYLYSVSNFYRSDGSILGVDTLDQRKALAAKTTTIEGSINYTEPIWKNTVLALSYSLSYNKGRSLYDTYNKAGGKYEDTVDSLSSHFESGILTQKGTVNFQISKGRFIWVLGANVLKLNFKQSNLVKNETLHFQYNVVIPYIGGHYNFDGSHVIFFSYNGTTQEPSMAQLQPLQNNNDPLHVTLGNPNLKPTVTHYFGLRFFIVRPVPINIGFQTNYSSNSISTRSYTDSLGRQIYQAVNINGNKDILAYLFFNKKSFLPRLDWGMKINLSYTSSFNFVNELLSRNDAYTADCRLSMGHNIQNKYLLQMSSRFSFSYSHSSINSGAATHYWTQTHSILLGIFLPLGFEWTTNCNIILFQKASAFDRKNAIVIWNTCINRNFLTNRLSMQIRVNDILRQNSGINRLVSANQITENRSNVAGRFAMLTLIYHFTEKRQK